MMTTGRMQSQTQMCIALKFCKKQNSIFFVAKKHFKSIATISNTTLRFTIENVDDVEQAF